MRTNSETQFFEFEEVEYKDPELNRAARNTYRLREKSPTEAAIVERRMCRRCHPATMC